MPDQYPVPPHEFIYAETDHNSFIGVHRKMLQRHINRHYQQVICGEISSVANGLMSVMYDIPAVTEWINSNMISEHGFNEMIEWFKIK